MLNTILKEVIRWVQINNLAVDDFEKPIKFECIMEAIFEMGENYMVLMHSC